ncbi:hypothetical protein AHAS_Ahas17G0115800 [Arachis hypogaea]
MQRHVANVHSTPLGAPYEMSNSSPFGETCNYSQYTPEQVNYMESSSRNSNDAPYSQTFNLRWRNHSNFEWREQHQRQQPYYANNFQGGFNQNQFHNLHFQHSQPQSVLDLETIMAELSKGQQSFMQETKASLRKLEMKVDQLSDTVSNSRKEC